MLDISIHAPREGCDKTTIRAVLITLIFQSTHPARGATHSFPIPSNGYGNFNPRTPRGVRHSEGLAGQGDGDISIHAPREGCDPFILPQLLQSLPISIHAPREGCDQTVEWDEPFTSFQSTHPARGATPLVFFCNLLFGISIHAPREGCDSRTPRPGKPQSRFQSTHPARGATQTALY